ncbi:Pyruvate dehydrogenase E1 component subunit beta [Fusarium oxysporum f. sp. albedinis]|nr:Pyruvate dehydrogenase E1 component subunit beta [Fusarium oxysporum f. sp. albedinis]
MWQSERIVSEAKDHTTNVEGRIIKHGGSMGCGDGGWPLLFDNCMKAIFLAEAYCNPSRCKHIRSSYRTNEKIQVRSTRWIYPQKPTVSASPICPTLVSCASYDL